MLRCQDDEDHLVASWPPNSSPVQSDGAEVEDAGGAAEHVSRQPDLAGDGAEYPATQHRVGNIQGQHSEGNLVVCNIIFID